MSVLKEIGVGVIVVWLVLCYRTIFCLKTKIISVFNQQTLRIYLIGHCLIF